MDYNKFDLIITNNYLKEEILKNASFKKELLKVKIMTLTEFKDNLCGRILKDSIYFLMHKYNLTYNLTKVYLANIYFLKDYFQDLIDNKLIKINSFFISSFQHILVINEVLDSYILNLLKDKQITYQKQDKFNYVHNVYEFSSLEDEVNFAAIKIRELMKNVDINNIKLVNVTSDYVDSIQKIFSFYQIPINLNSDSTIYKTYTCQRFIKILKETRLITEALESIPQNEVYNHIVDLINQFDLNEIDDIKIEIIIEELRFIKKNNLKYKKMIELINLNEVVSDDKYYILLGCNEGVIPRISKDEDFFSDLEKKSLGIITSVEKNILSETEFKNIFFNTKNLLITYKLNSSFTNFLPSYLIMDMGLHVIKNHPVCYNYSNIFNKISLAQKMDDFTKYNEKPVDLEKLLYNYPDINYQSYQNAYQKVDLEQYLKNINNNLKLSYTSINDYFNCAFKYYLKRVLKLETTTETLALIIGNLFHDILSKIYNQDFDLEKEYASYLNGKQFSAKQKFFLGLLKDELKFIIKTIKEMEKQTALKKVLTEKPFEIKINNVTINGIIDKILFNEFEDKTLAVVIDYKTGQLATNLDNLNYGFNLQLPMYLYLLKNYRPKVEIGGFYYQKILHNYRVGESYSEKKKLLKWEGFSIHDEQVLELIDKSYPDSMMIKSLKKKKTGGFYVYSKLLTKDDINQIIEIVKLKIDEASKGIFNIEFNINPKRIDRILLGCQHCSFSDICYKKEEDIIDLKTMKITDLLKGEE